MANCITPSSFAGGNAMSITFNAGFGGSPAKSTVRYVNESGSYNPPSFELDQSQSVGISGMTRPQTPVSYHKTTDASGSVFVVEFEDKAIIDLYRTAIVLRPKDSASPVGNMCTIILGDLYYKAPGSPNRVDETTLIPGSSPTIREGNRWKKIAEEHVRYTGSALAGSISNMIGSGLSSQLSGIRNLLNLQGGAMDVLQSLSKTYGFSLYANSSGKLDAVDTSAGISIGDAISNVGAECNIVSMKSGASIIGTTAQGSYVTYNHHDEWLADKVQKFKALDLLGLGIPACGGGKVGLYSEDMQDQEKEDLKRLLKIAILDSKWQNWDGMVNYVHVKRLIESAANESYEAFTKANKKPDDKAKKMQKNCMVMGTVKVLKDPSGTCPNITVNKLFPCCNPAYLEAGKFLEDFEKAFKTLDVKGQNPKIAPPPRGGSQIICVGEKGHAMCQGGDVVMNPAQPVQGHIGGNMWQKGGAADRAELLGALASTVGRFWLMSGGGGGGGAGLITERQHNLRDYTIPHGSLIWYHKKLSVRDTVFSAVYEKIYGDQIAEWEKAGGVMINNNLVGINDLSVSQFLQLAAKSKQVQLAGGDVEEEEKKAFAHGNGVDGDELAKQAEKHAEYCNNNEPKGIVIWDSGDKEVELPEQDPVLASMAAGIEAHSDRGGNDIIRFLTMQLDLAVIMNPNLNAPKNCPNPGDEIDQSLDNILINKDFDHIGQRRSKSIDYKEKEPRDWNYTYQNFVPCSIDAYRFSVEHADISGQVLWRDVDCYGNIKPWDRAWNANDSAAVINAAATKAGDLYIIRSAPDSTFTVSTCGGVAANLPSVGQGLQDYSVVLEEDGSISSTFTVSSRERLNADNMVMKTNFGGGDGVVSGGPSTHWGRKIRSALTGG